MCICAAVFKDKNIHRCISQVRNQKKELPQAFWGKSRYPVFLI